MRIMLLVAVGVAAVGGSTGCKNKAKAARPAVAVRTGDSVTLRREGKPSIPLFGNRDELDDFLGKVDKGGDADFLLHRLGGKTHQVAPGTTAVVREAAIDRYLVEVSDADDTKHRGWVSGDWVEKAPNPTGKP